MKKVTSIFEGLVTYADGTTAKICELSEVEQDKVYIDFYGTTQPTKAQIIEHQRAAGILHTGNHDRPTIAIKTPPIPNGTAQPEPQPDSTTEPLLILKSAAQWLAEGAAMPPQKQLFGEFWHVGELSILFGETGCGKSILAVQIADALTKGKGVLGMKNESPPVPVLYFDFELSTPQFFNRYADGFGTYPFAPSFIRVAINSDSTPENFERELLEGVERSAVETGAKVLIIDNFTFFSDELEKARNALPFIKSLKAIKERNGLSILILGHCPKRDSSRPITGNDLAGSRNLSNFVDSTFAVGFSTSAPNRRYLKQIKVRACGTAYGTNNVVVADIVRHGSMTQFEFVVLESEQEHLTAEKSWIGRPSKQDTIDAAKVFEGSEKLTTSEIVPKLVALSLSERSAKRWIKQAVENEVITKGKHGEYSLVKIDSAKSAKSVKRSEGFGTLPIGTNDDNTNEWLADENDNFPFGLVE